MTAPFPIDLPADIDDLASIAANDWAAFEKVDEMVNHWDRPGWREGRRSYHWILSFADNAEPSAMAQECFQACEAYAFEQVPLDALHLTIRRVAFTDEVNSRTLEAIAGRVAMLCAGLESFFITVGPLAGSADSVRFSVSPWSRLFEVYDLIGEASRWAPRRELSSAAASFLPHVSIAYSRQRQDAVEIHESINQYRTRPLVACKVAKVELVELRRELSAYRWRAIGGVDL